MWSMTVRSLSEFLGTFLLIAMVIASKGNPVAVVISLAIIILLGNVFTTIYVNPAISLVSFLNGHIAFLELTVCVVAQMTGVIAAYMVMR